MVHKQNTLAIQVMTGSNPRLVGKVKGGDDEKSEVEQGGWAEAHETVEVVMHYREFHIVEALDS